MDRAAHEQIIAQARAVLIDLQDRALARTLLAQMPAWIAAGAVPPAAEIADALARLSADDIDLVRKSFIRQWGYAIPCAEAVAALRTLGPLVEVGAGTGYWTALLSAAGHDVIATDLTAGIEHPYAFKVGSVTEVAALGAGDAVLANPQRHVLCSWPTQGAGWLAEAVAQMQPGLALALIGEDRGGVTGDAGLFDSLEADFTLLQRAPIPTFPRAHDHLAIYRRR